eukprot:scaffold6652_cov62-Phaeocystis_antarctica.AAC.2
MATVYPAARNLCAAATYMRLRETVRCPQNIGTNISTTTATLLWRSGVGCSTNPPAAATRTLARRCASRSSFTRLCACMRSSFWLSLRPSLRREADS